MRWLLTRLYIYYRYWKMRLFWDHEAQVSAWRETGNYLRSAMKEYERKYPETRNTLATIDHHRRSPLPSPEAFAAYIKHRPEAGHEILGMAEELQRQRHKAANAD